MNIALVVDGLQVGGIERVCSDYAKILLELGNKVTIINLNPHLTAMEDEFPPEVTIQHWCLPRKMCGEQYAQLIKYNAAGRFFYPIVFSIMEIANYIYKFIYKLTPIGREKYDLVIAFSGHFNDLTFVAKDYIKSKKKLCWLHGALYGYLLISDGFYNLYKKIQNLITLVDDAQEEALIVNHNEKLNIYKLYNPTFIENKDKDYNKINDLKQEYGKFLLMVSRFEYPHKDHYTVCDAFEILINKGYELNLLFVGNGTDEEKVKHYVKQKQKKVSDHVYFVGVQKDVQNYYSAAHLLVHASVAGEGLPTVQLEAMAYGLPQVVTDSKVGPREILQDNKYGLLCKVRDPEDMAEKIQTLLEDECLYNHFSKISKERLRDFSPSVIKTQLEEILKDVINN